MEGKDISPLEEDGRQVSETSEQALQSKKGRGIVRKIFLSLFVLMFLVVAGLIYLHPFSNSKRLVSQESIRAAILPASELVTSKYAYSDVNVYDAGTDFYGMRVPFTTDRVIFTYEGVVNAGIDLDKVNIQVDNENKKIQIDLPDPKILSHEVDESSYKYYDVKNSIFTEIAMEDYTKLVSKLKADKEAKLVEDDEFFKTVSDNAKNVLKGFLLGADELKDYQINFHS